MAKSTKTKTPRPYTNNFGLVPPSPLVQRLIGLWLTAKEANDICTQFQRLCVPNRQVLWSGLLREYVQKWADHRDYQTLTTALGPLLDPSRLELSNHRKPSAGWAGYMHGASVIFAWYISQGDLVTVLSQPTPQRFHPPGLTYYQTVEEPIIKGKLGNRAVGKIVAIHPTVGGKAEDFKYELWPQDELSRWTTNFGIPQLTISWRATKGEKKLKHVQLLKVRCSAWRSILSLDSIA